jgi:hypothetical protein
VTLTNFGSINGVRYACQEAGEASVLLHVLQNTGRGRVAVPSGDLLPDPEFTEEAIYRRCLPQQVNQYGIRVPSPPWPEELPPQGLAGLTIHRVVGEKPPPDVRGKSSVVQITVVARAVP